MDQNRAISKIKKCLSLAGSSNQHEAKIALSQARALMKKYGLCEKSLVEAEMLVESRDSYNRLPLWVNDLAALIAIHCGCSIFHSADDKKLFFVGQGSKVELGLYLYDVLLAKAKTDRRAFLERNKQISAKRNVSTSPSEARIHADEFSLGWVAGISSIVYSFMEDERDNEEIEAHKKAFSDYFAPDLEFKKQEEKVVHTSDNFVDGYILGSDQVLWRPLEEGETQELLKKEG